MAYKQKEYREKMKRDGSGMEQKTYILLNAGGTEINGTDQSRGNGSKKSADSTDGAMLLPETCEECCGETHGLYHYVSEKKSVNCQQSRILYGIAVSVSAGGT